MYRRLSKTSGCGRSGDAPRVANNTSQMLQRVCDRTNWQTRPRHKTQRSAYRAPSCPYRRSHSQAALRYAVGVEPLGFPSAIAKSDTTVNFPIWCSPGACLSSRARVGRRGCLGERRTEGTHSNYPARGNSNRRQSCPPLWMMVKARASAATGW